MIHVCKCMANDPVNTKCYQKLHFNEILLQGLTQQRNPLNLQIAFCNRHKIQQILQIANFANLKYSKLGKASFFPAMTTCYKTIKKTFKGCNILSIILRVESLKSCTARNAISTTPYQILNKNTEDKIFELITYIYRHLVMSIFLKCTSLLKNQKQIYQVRYAKISEMI